MPDLAALRLHPQLVLPLFGVCFGMETVHRSSFLSQALQAWFEEIRFRDARIERAKQAELRRKREGKRRLFIGGLVTFACDGTITLSSHKDISIDTTLDATGRQVTINTGIISGYRATLDRVKSFNTAVKEARKIRSKVVDYEGGTGLQIEGVGRDESTLFGKLGFQEKDVLLGLDGERLDFDSLSGAASMIPGSEANQLYDRFKEQLESGAPIAVDVVRNGRPMQIFFALDDRL